MRTLIKCINCDQEHKEKFVQYDILGEPWCEDCMMEVINSEE